MPYCTLSDLTARLPETSLIQLTDELGLGMVDTAKTTAAIERAGQEIDAWCGGRYQVPFAAPPAILTALAAELAIYYLYGRTQDEIPEAWKDAHKNALALLRAIAEGKVSLGEAPQATAPATAGVKVSAPGRVIDRDRLGNF